MRPRALLVHACFGCFSVLFSLEKQVYRLLVRGYGKRVDALDIDAFMRALANLKKLEAVSKQVKNLFIVNLHIRALNNDLIGRSFDILEQILQQSRKYTPGL